MSTSSPSTDPTSSAPEAPQAPEPLTEPGQPDRLAELVQLGRYIPYNQLPTLNDVPAILAALIYGDTVGDYVAELRRGGYSDAEIASYVSHVISPPVPGATANVIQGVDPAAHAALQDQVAELRSLVESFTAQRAELPAGATATAPGSAQAPATTAGVAPVTGAQDPREQEVQELRALVDSLSAQVAAGQHPTATSEEVPPPPADVTPAPAPDVPTEPAPAVSDPPAADTTPSEGGG